MSEKIEDINKVVGRRLLIVRMFNGVSRRELSRSLEITAATIYNNEVGRVRVTIGFVNKYSEYFNIPIDWFYSNRPFDITYIKK